MRHCFEADSEFFSLLLYQDSINLPGTPDHEVIFGRRRNYTYWYVTTDPQTLPENSTSYVMTNIPNINYKDVGYKPANPNNFILVAAIASTCNLSFAH